MKRSLFIGMLMTIGVMLFVTCRKPFMPDIGDIKTNVLIVEGVINNGADSTIIKLSRSIELDYRYPSYALTIYNPDKNNVKPELNATITVESDQAVVYSLKHLGKGRYGAPAAVLDNAQKYHLKIVTQAGAVYTSTAEAVKDAPPIDSLLYKFDGGGVSFYANTGTGDNSGKYYRWEYEETWRFKVPVRSNFVSTGTTVIRRPYSVEYCYGFNNSTGILLASTVKLSRDIITEQPLTSVSGTDEKLSLRYSILLKQYALSQAGYEFWDNIKRNTEDLGGIFDKQPAAPISNIQCITDPALPVLGFVSVGRISTKRIFIDKMQLPAGYNYTDPNNCPITGRFFVDGTAAGTNTVARDVIPFGSLVVPVEEISGASGVVGYTVTSIFCADCTVRGVVPRPYYWKD